MQKYVILFCLSSILSTPFCNAEVPLHNSKKLFTAIAPKRNVNLIEKLLNQNISATTRHEAEGNSPLMEAIIALGEKLLEIEAQSLSQEISHNKHLNENFRSFLRSFIISLILAISTSEIQSNIEKINNETNSAFITLLQSISKSFLPVISRSAYAWCAYSLLDYGIATGQKESHGHSNNDSGPLEKYQKTIDLLLSNTALDINHINHDKESALSLIRGYKDKIKSAEFKILLYRIEQALLHEEVYSYPSHYTQASAAA